MTDKPTKNNQFLKASEMLTDMRPNVAAEDRKAASEKFGLSRVTIGSYLHGQVRDLHTAEMLITFFRAAIERRDRVFNSTPTIG